MEPNYLPKHDGLLLPTDVPPCHVLDALWLFDSDLQSGRVNIM